MESERLRITLDNPERTYYAGQTIKGEIWMNLNKRTKIRAVKIQITGKGKCKWMEILRKNSNNNESTRSLFYSSKEVYTHSESPISTFEPRGVELSPGEHTFDFMVPLDWHLPSSFKGSHGSIKYKMRVLIQRPWTFDERHTIPLVVVKSMPLPISCRLNAIPLEKQITKTISLFGTRPITMLALLPENFAVRGEPLRICVTVMNNSTTNVEKLRFTVLQYITYYSHVPLRVQKVECQAIANKETGSVHKKSERSFAHELLMPETAQPTDDQFSGVINIAYELRVEAVLRGFFKNLVLNLPFKVYSHDGAANLANVQTRPPPESGGDCVASGGGGNNPFEPAMTGAVAHAMPMPVYPALDSSIGSPSHSSQYSECSSLNSTTSDSSATTLSPAVGIGGTLERSYISGGSQSSQYNSPSARASIRSSNVPYMPYSSSPLMVQSYPPHIPPYPLSESPQYTLMSHPTMPMPLAQDVGHTHEFPSSQEVAHTSDVYPLPHEFPSSQEVVPTYIRMPLAHELPSSQEVVPTYIRMPLAHELPSSQDAAPTYAALQLAPPSRSGYMQLPSTSGFFQTRQHAGPLELPPSYEELFGSATAPPDTPK